MVPRKRLMREPEARFGNRQGSTGGAGEDNDRAGEPGTGRGGRGAESHRGRKDAGCGADGRRRRETLA